MIWSAKPRLLVAAIVPLLFPVWAPGESQMASEPHSASGGLVATAHVLFKIVIPQTLLMEIADGERAEQAITISGNDRKRTAVSIVGADLEPPRMVLHAVGHRTVVQFAACEHTGSAPGVSCTVSMP